MKEWNAKKRSKDRDEKRWRTLGGGRTKTAKTGSVWSVLNNNNCLYCFRDDSNVSERRRRQKYTFDPALLRPVYSSSLSLPAPLDLLRCIFLRFSLLIFRWNGNRLAYIPPWFHFGFRAALRKDFMGRRQKSLPEWEMEVSLFPDGTCKACKGHAARIKQISGIMAVIWQTKVCINSRYSKLVLHEILGIGFCCDLL